MDTMERHSLYDHDIPSLSASLEAFDPERSQHSAYSARSTMNSSRWSVPHDHDDSEPESEGPWAPPAWQKSNNTWYRKSLLARSSRSPFDVRDITPSRIPLPESPSKGTPRASPDPGGPDYRYSTDNIASRMQSPAHGPNRDRDRDPDLDPDLDAHVYADGEPDAGDSMALSHNADPTSMDGFVRFAIRGETLFRTAPIEDTISSFASGMHVFTRSRRNVIFTLATMFFSWLLLQPWTASLVPDIANVAGMAKQFEPLMYASENVIPRSRELAEASIAVQDLGESVRATNMSASSIIIDQLDDLGDSLKVLSEKLTSFFTNVDSDLDSILLSMEWTKRELQAIQRPKIGMLDTVVENIHGALNKVGALEQNGTPTALGRVITDVLGHTTLQRSKDTLQRTFDYLLGVLEENIANELTRADVLFQLFESVDRQFHNLHRSVAREEDSLSTKKDEFLASLWRMSITNKMRIKKYEKNLKLLKDVRASTLVNKSELKSHIQIIHSVKDQLDKARRNLVSPLIRRAQSNSFGLEQQVSDLAGTYGFLKDVRDVQKRRVMEQLWGGDKKRVAITAGGGAGVGSGSARGAEDEESGDEAD